MHLLVTELAALLTCDLLVSRLKVVVMRCFTGAAPWAVYVIAVMVFERLGAEKQAHNAQLKLYARYEKREWLEELPK